MTMEKFGRIFVGDEEGNLHTEQREIKQPAKPETRFSVNEKGVVEERKSRSQKEKDAQKR